MGRVGRCVNAISSTERLPSVFLPCYPGKSSGFFGRQQVVWQQISLKKQAKTGRFACVFRPSETKTAHNQTNTSTKHRILCGSSGSYPPPPYAINLISTFEKIGICNGTPFYAHGTRQLAHKKTAPTTICTVIRAYPKNKTN